MTIGDVTFDWEPATPSGIDTVLTRRGADVRLENTDRVGADERKAARKQRRAVDDAERSDAEERRQRSRAADDAESHD